MGFEKFLTILTLITGIIWLINKFLPRKGSNFNKHYNLYEIIDYIASFFIIFLIVLLLRTFFVEPYRIPTGSMRPTLLEGDFILVNKYKYGLRLPITHKKILPVAKPKRGDVIIFWQEKSKKILIKRVIGLPGEHIVYKDQNLYINDQLVNIKDLGFLEDQKIVVNHKQEFLDHKKVSHDIYLIPNDPRQYPYSDLIVGKNSYFVMGDNRGNSADSRQDGAILEKDILGKAFFIWMSIDSNNWVLRFERMWKKIK